MNYVEEYAKPWAKPEKEGVNTCQNGLKVFKAF